LFSWEVESIHRKIEPDFYRPHEDRPMTPNLETLATVGPDLDEARTKLQAARDALQAAPQDAPEIRQAVLASSEWRPSWSG
jgi:hypothetical protein